MKIQVEVSQAYGRKIIRPVCPQAKLFAALAKQSTLTDRELAIIKQLGFTIEVIQPVVTL